MLTQEQCMMILKSINGLVATDEHGVIIYFDELTAEGMGIKSEDCLGKYIKDILPLTKIHTTLETKQHDIGDFYFIDDKKHRQHPIVISTRHPMYNNGKFSGVVEYDLFENYYVLKQFLSNTNSLLNELTVFKKRAPGNGYTIDELKGNGEAMQTLRTEIYKAANSNSTVMITGETGSGKELAAHAIHNLSKRKNNPFIAVNCSAIPAELFESEFFGYEEGSFTSAKKGGKLGKFELANTGTLFLDEINSLSMSMQPKLLRALQEGQIDRVGGKNSIPVDVRIICASNQPLQKLVDEEKFRQDLLFRINVLPLEMPPLRKRIEDIPEIMDSIVKKLNLLLGKRVEYIDEDMVKLMQQYEWPGNVRELQNLLERAMNNVDANTEQLTKYDLPNEFLNEISKKTLSLEGSNPIRQAQDAVEKELILLALKKAGGNKTQAASLLKIARQVLYKKMVRLHINDSDVFCG